MSLVERQKAKNKWFLPGIVSGLNLTLRKMFGNLMHKDRMPTVNYPEERYEYSPRFKGNHVLTVKKDGSLRCTACMLCATACPADCIEIVASEHEDPSVEKYPIQYNIDVLRCVFCGYCEEACPVDAIVGAARQMHTVISGECTGCSLCLEPCPVDCIQMVLPNERSSSIEIGLHVSWTEPDHQDYEVEKVERVEKKKAADRARARYQLRLQRLEREKQRGREERLAKRTEATATVARLSSAASLKKITIRAALERAKAARTQASPGISKKEA